MAKVCHMSSVHRQGDTRIFFKECTSLAKAGHEVYLVIRGESGFENGVHIVGVGQPSGNRLTRMTAFSQKVYEAALALDADIYHFHDPELLPYGLKLKRKGKKVIFDSHENTAGSILEKPWIPPVFRKLSSRLYARYETKICHSLDVVVAVTPQMGDYFKNRCARVVVISNFPVYDENAPISTHKEKRLVFAGGVTPQWMHVNIISVLSQFPDCRYTLCGPGTEEYLAQLQKLPGWAQTDYLGKIPHENVAEHLREASIGMALLRPGSNTHHHIGTLGNTKIFEEMMEELPVVCTDFEVWREFVVRYHCGICVDPENVDEVAFAIRYLLDHPEEARKMGENGRRAVKEEFNWGIEEKKLLALYEELSSELSNGGVSV